MPVTTRLTAAMLAISLVAAPAAADAKKKKRAKGPTKAVVTKELGDAYCAPIEAMSGPIATAKVTVGSMKRGKRRRGRSRLDGTPANRKTWVFPIRASYFCDYTATANANPGWVPDDRRIAGDYIFFRDEFGSWTHRYKGHERTDVPGS